MLIGLGKHMGLPQDGEDVDGNPIAMDNAWDWHKQLVGNIAGEGDGVPGADLDAKRNYVLARGGRFEEYTEAYDGEQMNHQFTGPIYFFNETLAQTIDSIIGVPFDGHARYEPIADLGGNIGRSNRCRVPVVAYNLQTGVAQYGPDDLQSVARFDSTGELRGDEQFRRGCAWHSNR